MDWLNVAVIVVYLGAMVGFGFWGRARTKKADDYLLAGRRLGFGFYTSTMVVVVLGGASAVGGVGLGYKFGISGFWMVAAIGVGVLVLSAFFASKMRRLRIYTVVQMLLMRYGTESTQAASIIMLAYTLMLAATSTGAYASIFIVVFGWDRWLAILVGGAVVLLYSTIGGMYSITLADVVQFFIMTIGLFGLMIPFGLSKAGGWSAMHDRLDAEFFNIGGIGLQSIITYFVIYTLGILIGQDIWQRVFTSRTPEIAQRGGIVAGIYCILFGIGGAIAGMAAKAVMPTIENKDAVFGFIATDLLPAGLGGIALAAGIAAMMSTASGALIAASTVATKDVRPFLKKLLAGKRPKTLGVSEVLSSMEEQRDQTSQVKQNQLLVLVLGAASMVLAMAVPDVVAALTISYAILVGGLLVAIIGGFVWSRGNGAGAAWSMMVGTIVTLSTMIYLELNAETPLDGIYANEPIYFGLLASFVTFVLVSLLTPSTPQDIKKLWKESIQQNKAAEETEVAQLVASTKG